MAWAVFCTNLLESEDNFCLRKFNFVRLSHIENSLHNQWAIWHDLSAAKQTVSVHRHKYGNTCTVHDKTFSFTEKNTPLQELSKCNVEDHFEIYLR